MDRAWLKVLDHLKIKCRIGGILMIITKKALIKVSFKLPIDKPIYLQTIWISKRTFPRPLIAILIIEKIPLKTHFSQINHCLLKKFLMNFFKMTSLFFHIQIGMISSNREILIIQFNFMCSKCSKMIRTLIR